MNLRRTAQAILFCLVCTSALPAAAEAPREGPYSKAFLSKLSEVCWFGTPLVQRRGRPARPLVALTLHNPSANDLLPICVYDLACGEIVFSGQILRRSRHQIRVCPDSRGRGHVLMLDTHGNIFERRDLRSPTTLSLWSVGRR